MRKLATQQETTMDARIIVAMGDFAATAKNDAMSVHGCAHCAETAKRRQAI